LKQLIILVLSSPELLNEARSRFLVAAQVKEWYMPTKQDLAPSAVS
jgi:hypothetical protein